MNRTILHKLAGMRIEEARILLGAKQYSGANYLAGYAVECGLKAVIAKKTKRHSFPDKKFVDQCYTHNLDQLVGQADLKDALKTADKRIQRNWGIVKDWSEQTRYEKKPRALAKALYDAITDANWGILPWIRSNW